MSLKDLLFATMGANGGDVTGDGYEAAQNELQKGEPQCGGGVSSWNDLTDKPFGEEISLVEVVPETTVDGFEDQDGFYQADVKSLFESNGFKPVVGNKYSVNYNGKTYVCTAQLAPEATMAEWVYERVFIGNYGILGGEDTGEPFCIALLKYEGAGYREEHWIFQTNGNPCTISITEEKEVVHKLDAKYMPYGNTTPEPITFDGNLDSKETVNIANVIVVKVSNTPITPEAVIGGTLTVRNIADGKEDVVSIESDMVMAQNGIVMIDQIVVSIESNGTEMANGTVLNRGLYFVYSEEYSVYCAELTFPKQIKTIPAEWLPYVMITETVPAQSLSCNVSDFTTLLAKLEAYPLIFYRCIDTNVGCIVDQSLMSGYAVDFDDNDNINVVIFSNLSHQESFIFKADGTITYYE